MIYPEWAPEILVEGYKMWMATPPAERKSWMTDPNDDIAELVRRGVPIDNGRCGEYSSTAVPEKVAPSRCRKDGSS